MDWLNHFLKKRYKTRKKEETGKDLAIVPAQFNNYRFGTDFRKVNSTYNSCVDTLARAFSMIFPVMMYKGERDESDFNLGILLHLRPNPYQSATQFYSAFAHDYFFLGIAVARLTYDYSRFGNPLVAITMVNTDNIVGNPYTDSNGDLWFKIIDSVTGKADYVPRTELIICVRRPSASNPLFRVDESLNQILGAIADDFEGFSAAVHQSKMIKFLVKPSTLMSDYTQFKKDWVDQINDGTGILVQSDASQVTPISTSPVYAKQPELDEYISEIYSYFGITKKATQSDFTDTTATFFNSYALGGLMNDFRQELTYAIFTKNEIAHGNSISIMPNDSSSMSPDMRAKYAQLIISSGYYTPNEIRAMLGTNKIDGGDNVVQSLNFKQAGEADSSVEPMANVKKDNVEEE